MARNAKFGSARVADEVEFLAKNMDFKERNGTIGPHEWLINCLIVDLKHRF